MDSELTPERRTFIAVALCFAIYVGWTYFQMQRHRHDPAPPAATAQGADAAQPLAPQAPLSAALARPPAAASVAPGEVAPPPEPAEQLVELDSPEFHLVLSSHGGTLVKAVLKNPKYQRAVEGKDEPVELALPTKEGHRPLETTFAELGGLTADAAYDVNRDADGQGVRFVRHQGAVTVEKHVRLVSSYLAELEITVSGGEPGTMTLVYSGPQPEGSSASTSLFGLGRSVPNVATGICRVAGTSQRGEGGKEGDTKVASATFPKDGSSGEVAFAGIDERYFLGAVYPAAGNGLGHCTVSSLKSGTVSAAMDLPLAAGKPSRFGLYLGPKDVVRLRAASALPGSPPTTSAALETAVDFGFWTALCLPMLLTMEFFHSKVAHNWGLAILLLTLAIKLVLFPLQQRFFKTQEQMRKLAPQIEALKKKYASDKERLNMETMKLYSDNGANPFASCLPMLLQLPIWFALYRLLGTTIQLYREPFVAGWINDLTGPDPFYILPLGMGATMIVTQFLTPQTTLDNTQQKFMMWFMPAFFTLTFLKVPAGLSLYIVSSNLLNIGQQYWLRRRYGTPVTDVRVDKK